MCQWRTNILQWQQPAAKIVYPYCTPHSSFSWNCNVVFVRSYSKSCMGYLDQVQNLQCSFFFHWRQSPSVMQRRLFTECCTVADDRGSLKSPFMLPAEFLPLPSRIRMEACSAPSPGTWPSYLNQTQWHRRGGIELESLEVSGSVYLHCH